jgi:hypothetical protein
MELSPNEQALLAREVAADGYGHTYSEYRVTCPECAEQFFNHLAHDYDRNTFQAGWDAAMDYMEKQRAKVELG